MVVFVIWRRVVLSSDSSHFLVLRGLKFFLVLYCLQAWGNSLFANDREYWPVRS